MTNTTALTFTASADKGDVSALYSAASNPRAFFLLAHGAGANMRHAHMSRLAEVLLAQNISSLRFNFPYMEAGGNRTDALPVCLETISNAVTLARKQDTSAPFLLAGHSFGGRMSSHFAASLDQTADDPVDSSIRGLVYFSFPLHPGKKPDIKRAGHLPQIKVPQLFISGTRDTLADVDLLEPVVAQLKNARLHLLDTADHSYKILKRTRKSTQDVYEEAAEAVSTWLDSTL